jgi:hypothetical protein
LTAQDPIDLIKDDLALQLFTLTNLIRLFQGGNIMGAYFLIRFISLNLAIRNSVISDNTKLALF